MRLMILMVVFCGPVGAEVVPVEGQALGGNVGRVVEAFEMLGWPLGEALRGELEGAVRERDGARMQALLEPLVVVELAINPEERVKVRRGEGKAVLQQGGWVPLLVKVVNLSTATKRLRVSSPQAGPVYGGATGLSMQRMVMHELGEGQGGEGMAGRFLSLEVMDKAPMTERLSGLEVEYVVLLGYSAEAGKREATLGFDIGEGTADLGFRGEVPVLFDVRPAVPVVVRVRDENGRAGMARLRIEDEAGRVYPTQAKRLAPDLFFQKHIYREDGEVVLLPPGKFRVWSSRGPEYRVRRGELEVVEGEDVVLAVELERWVEPEASGFFGGDHHIHAAGCAHYTAPTEGVTPEVMFRQVKGEGLRVGCVLTWGPCFDFQRQFFEPGVKGVSDGETLLKYDLEVSGFGSQALGHVCLLNLKEQSYPGSDGRKDKGWPTWTTPVMRWAKEQGGYAGYAHSASGLQIDPKAAAGRMMAALDGDGSGGLSEGELAAGLWVEGFARSDVDGNGVLGMDELVGAHRRAAGMLPNYAVPEMNGVGAMEICVAVSEGACDFISAMDTSRIQEWNTWYHLMNCGFQVAVSGETDFPCMSSRRVGAGRVYVRLGAGAELEYGEWCRGLAEGRSYVSDGFAHALEFKVDGVRPGEGTLAMAGAGKVRVEASVAFAPETPETVAQGLILPEGGRRWIGDTVNLHAARTERYARGGERLVELVVNGEVVAERVVAADGVLKEMEFEVVLEESSWVALRQFPQLHTNAVFVEVGGVPVRALARSARWCREMTQLLWRNREGKIAEGEREAARAAFERTYARFREIEEEAEMLKR